MIYFDNEEKKLEENQKQYKNEIEEYIRSYEEASLIEENIKKLNEVTEENENKDVVIEAKIRQMRLALEQNQQNKTSSENKIIKIRENLQNLQPQKTI